MVSNDHYKMNIKASNLIDDLCKEKKHTVNEIAFKVLKEFGLTMRFTKVYVNQLIDLKKVIVKAKGVLAWKGKEKKR